MKPHPQFLALTLAALLTQGSLLASQVVTNTNDTGAGSLRQAIANAGPGEDITFTPSLDGQTITLTSGQIVIAKNLVIDASALPGGITVENDSDRMFQIEPSGTVTMNSLTLANGRCPNAGGAILNHGGTLTLNSCRLAGNSCNNDGGGGAILNDTGASLTLNRCVLTGNNANGEPGGAIATRSVGTMVINKCSIIGNAAGAEGGGIHNLAAMTVINSTLADNSAYDGGGIRNGYLAFATLNNCTVSGNTADNEGGGIYSEADEGIVTLNHCTVSANSADQGGGIRNGADLTLVNSIVAGNTATTSAPDVLQAGYYHKNAGVNFIGDTSGAGTIPGNPGANYLTGDPLLAPLGAYGGPTWTMPPRSGSPVIDAAAMVGGTPATDQRGLPRPSGTGPDIGSVEVKRIRHQPDAKIRARGTDAFKGDNVYRSINQKRVQRARTIFKERTRKRVFLIAIQNDGNVPESFVVKGHRGNKRFSVKYIYGGMDVTRKVARGNLKTETLAPGAEAYLRMEVRLDPAYLTRRPRQLFWVLARSSRESGRHDTVWADLKSPKK